MNAQTPTQTVFCVFSIGAKVFAWYTAEKVEVRFGKQAPRLSIAGLLVLHHNVFIVVCNLVTSANYWSECQVVFANQMLRHELCFHM